MNMITIFTDGSSRGNPGPGGWGSVVVSNDKVVELGGRADHTTNNRMELTAAIEGIKKARAVGGDILVYSDSSYVINGVTKWMSGWKRNGWMTKTKDDVSNKDLWMELDEAVNGVSVTWKYVGGHIGVAGNERCDEIATAYADDESPTLYNGSLSTYSIKNVLDVSHDETLLAGKKSSSSKSSAKAYSYVSSVGGKIEIHRTWPECEKRVKGAKGARYKKSISPENEKEIIDEFGALLF